MIEIWSGIWKFCLIAALLLFSGMALWVTVAGWFDIWRMFARLAEEKKEMEEQE